MKVHFQTPARSPVNRKPDASHQLGSNSDQASHNQDTASTLFWCYCVPTTPGRSWIVTGVKKLVKNSSTQSSFSSQSWKWSKLSTKMLHLPKYSSKCDPKFEQTGRYFCQLWDGGYYILAVSNCLADNSCLANGSLASCVRHNCAQLLRQCTLPSVTPVKGK